MSDVETEIVSGPEATEVAEVFSAQICGFISTGMRLDVVLCIAIAVLADYARGEYGDDYLDELADVLVSRRNEPLPPMDTVQ